MLLLHLFSLSLLAVVALAETKTMSTTEEKTKTTSTFTTRSTTATATHTIKVGPKTAPHLYVPHNITANVADIVVFEFYPANHSVVKADYLAPCVPASEGLFYSSALNTFDEDNGNLVGSVSR
jgi:plastocyanin